MEQQQLLDLIEKSRAGDRQAQEKLVGEAQNRVYYHCRKMLKNEEDALDATQDVLITILTSLDKLREPAAFWGWVNGITANRCKHLLTRSTKEWQIPEDEEGNSLLDSMETLDDQTVPDKVIDNSETQRLVLEIIDGLPPEQRMTVLFFYYDEMPVKEIAAAMEVSEGTVKSRLNYARKAIKEGVEKLEKKGTKLYGISPLPFLAYFLRMGAQSQALSPSAAAALTQGTLASVGTAGTVAGTAAGATAAVGTASSTGTAAAAAGTAAKGIIGSKIALGLAGLAVAGTVAGSVALSTRQAPPEPTPAPIPTAVMAMVTPTPEPTATPAPELSTKYREDYDNGEYLEVYVEEDGTVWFGSLIYRDTEDNFMVVSAGEGNQKTTRGDPGRGGYSNLTVTESAELTLKCYDNHDEAHAGSGGSERTFQNASVRVIAEDGKFWLEITPYEPPLSVPTSEPTPTPEPDPEETEASNMKDFVIEDGVLIKYNGPGGDVVIPDNVTTIGRHAFYDCTGLTGITISDNVTSIGSEAFHGCISLTSVTIPASVSSIDSWAFESTGLTEVTISGSPKMSGGSFGDCASLVNIYVYGNPSRLTAMSVGGGRTSYGWIDGSPNVTIYGMSGSTVETYAVRNNIPFVALDAPTPTANPDFTIENGVLVKYKGSGGDVVLPDGITKIGKRAFEMCKGLTGAVISESVTEIGEYAFCGCTSLTSLMLPEGITNIGEGAFYDCTSLTSITIPDSVVEIDSAAFSGCTSLTSVTIPGQVTDIHSNTFRDCRNLCDVTIKGNVTRIGNSAFLDCPSLTDITIPDSVSYIDPTAFYRITIHATTGSYAETYAKEEMFISFEAI